MVCANHASSLADVAILQSQFPRILHPLARSGLFKKPFLRIVLWFINAVPIYRAHDAGSDTVQNNCSFDRCYELLRGGVALMIFPEGISHTAPMLQPIKTGAARIALGSKMRNGPLPAIIPVGLTFVEKGRFRSRVLIQVGSALNINDVASSLSGIELSPGEDAPRDQVREVTTRLDKAMRALTLNADNWQDLLLMRQLERFFHFRDGRHPQATPLAQRFRTFKRLQEAQNRLRDLAPERLDALRRKLLWFERLRRVYGIDDYHLSVHIAKGTFLRAAITGLLLVLVLLPVAVWALVTSAIPFLLVRFLTPIVAKGTDQFETSKIFLGMNLFGLVWGGLIALVYFNGSLNQTLLFAASLPIASGLTLSLLSQRKKIRENLRAFFLYRRKDDLRSYLLLKRNEIENDVADLARIARTQGPLGDGT